MSCNICSLSQPVLEKIFSFLTNIKYYRNLQNVCKTWRHFIFTSPVLWETVNFGQIEKHELQHNIFISQNTKNTFPVTKLLQLSKIDSISGEKTDSLKIVSACSSKTIKVLDLFDENYETAMRLRLAFEYAISNFSSLKTLCINHTTIDFATNSIHALPITEIHVYAGIKISKKFADADELIELLTNHPTLETINMYYYAGVSHKQVKVLRESCPKFKVLKLWFCDDISWVFDHRTNDMIQKEQNAVEVYSVGTVNDQIMRELINNNGIGVGITTPLKLCKNWSLSTVQTKQMDDALSQLTNNFHTIQLLDLSGSNVTDNGLMLIATNCHNLKQLNLSKCSKINPGGIESILMNCPSLEYLNLQYCTQIDIGHIWHFECYLDNIVKPFEHLPISELSFLQQKNIEIYAPKQTQVEKKKELLVFSLIHINIIVKGNF